MSDHTCRHCRRCAAEALGIDLGAPLGPSEFRQLEEYLGLVPSGAPDLTEWLDVSGDPAVVEAQSAVAEREAQFAPVDEAWRDELLAARELELLADSQLQHVAAKARRALPRLRERLREADDNRTAAWAKVTKARTELAVATRAAAQSRLAGADGVKAAGADGMKDRPAAEQVRRAPGVAFVPMPVVKDGRTGS